MQNILPLKITTLGNIIITHKELSIVRRQRLPHLGRGPEKELAFLTLAISILSGIEATLRREHLAHNIVKGLLSDLAIELFARDQVRMQIKPAQESVIIEHLLKMRNQPVCINRVTM